MDPIPLNSLTWHDTSPDLDELLASRTQLYPLAQGREAGLFAAGTPPSLVVKLWPSGAHVAQPQSRLLRALAPLLPVPAALGWGVAPDGRDALAMSYAGRPLETTGPAQIAHLAALLARIHATPPPPFLPADRSHEDILRRLLPPDTDLAAVARGLLPDLPAFHPTLVHGDFHPGNVMLAGDPSPTPRLTIVDWTDARRSDWRYDLAWALWLLAVYRAEAQQTFLNAYLRAAGRASIPSLDLFLALVGLHWVHLARTAPVPINAEWWERAERLLLPRLPAPARSAVLPLRPPHSAR